MRNSDDYTVRLVDLPVECGGMVSLSPDGHFNIYLNARLDRATQREKFLHELRHIINDDFFNDDDIHTVESRADAHATRSRRTPRLLKASDLLQQTPTVAAASTPPRSQTNSHVTHLSPHQTAVLLRAISDLDDWLFRDTTYDI